MVESTALGPFFGFAWLGFAMKKSGLRVCSRKKGETTRAKGCGGFAESVKNYSATLDVWAPLACPLLALPVTTSTFTGTGGTFLTEAHVGQGQP